MTFIHPQLLAMLQCPVTKEDLYFTDGKLVSVDGKQTYSLFCQLPWLFKNSEYYKAYWSNKKTDFLNFHKQSALKLENEIKKSQSSPLTLQRLRFLKKAHEQNFETLSELLKDLDLNKQLNKKESFEVAVPAHQSLHLYRKNLFRDWGWDTDENNRAVHLIKDIVGVGWRPDSFCVLGSGASRLAIDLHSQFQLPMTVAVDFNPLLVLVAQAVNTGRSIPLYDFNTAPVEMKDVAKLYDLKSPYAPLNDIHFIFADVTDLPFKSHSFNSVLTPWLIDILPMAFSLLAQRVNRILAVGGEWVNFGPLGFSQKLEANNLTSEEIKEQLVLNGFEVRAEKMDRIEYLSAKDEVNSRNETVYLFKARKIKEVSVQDFDFMPSWLTDFTQPIPLSEELKNHQQLVRFQADLFHTIDGQLSINQIAKLFSAHYKIDSDIALKMVVNVLRQFEESLKRK